MVNVIIEKEEKMSIGVVVVVVVVIKWVEIIQTHSYYYTAI